MISPNNIDDIEIQDDDRHFYSKKDEPLSHSQLVMIAMKKCLDARAKEMKEGKTVVKKDRFGNELPVYIPDTRLEFIECAEALKMVMGVDCDEKTNKLLKEIEDEVKEIVTFNIKIQKEQWESLPIAIKTNFNRNGIIVYSERLTQGFGNFYNEYLADKVSLYTKVYIILDNRAKELNYYKDESMEA